MRRLIVRPSAEQVTGEGQVSRCLNLSLFFILTYTLAPIP